MLFFKQQKLELNSLSIMKNDNSLFLTPHSYPLLLRSHLSGLMSTILFRGRGGVRVESPKWTGQRIVKITHSSNVYPLPLGSLMRFMIPLVLISSGRKTLLLPFCQSISTIASSSILYLHDFDHFCPLVFEIEYLSECCYLESVFE